MKSQSRSFRPSPSSRPPPIHIPGRVSNVRALVSFFNQRAQERHNTATSSSHCGSRRTSRTYNPLPPPNLVKSLVTSYNRLITIFGIRPTDVSSQSDSSKVGDVRPSAVENLRGNQLRQAGVTVLPEANEANPMSPLVETITVSGGDNRETTYHAQEQVNSVKVWKGERDDYRSGAERSVVDDSASTTGHGNYFDQLVAGSMSGERRRSPKPAPTTPKIKSRIKAPRTHSHYYGSRHTNAIGERYWPVAGEERPRSSVCSPRNRNPQSKSPPSSGEPARSLSPGYRPKTPPHPSSQRKRTLSPSANHAPRLLTSVSPGRPASPILDRKTTIETSSSRTSRSPSPQAIHLPPSRSPIHHKSMSYKPQLPKLRTPSPRTFLPVRHPGYPERGRQVRHAKSRPAFQAARQRFEDLERAAVPYRKVSLNVIPATASSGSSQRAPFSNAVDDDPDATVRATQPGNSILRPFQQNPAILHTNTSSLASRRSQRSQRRLSMASWQNRSEPTVTISPSSQENPSHTRGPQPQNLGWRRWSHPAQKLPTVPPMDKTRPTGTLSSRMPGEFTDSQEKLDISDSHEGSINSRRNYKGRPILNQRHPHHHDARGRRSGRFHLEYADATADDRERIRVSPLHVVKKSSIYSGTQRTDSLRSSFQASEVSVKPKEDPPPPSVIRHRSKSRPGIENTTFQTPPISPPLDVKLTVREKELLSAAAAIQNQSSPLPTTPHRSLTQARLPKWSLQGGQSRRSPNKLRVPMVRGYFAPRMRVRSDNDWMKGLQSCHPQPIRLMAPESSELSPAELDGNNSMLNTRGVLSGLPQTESDLADATADTTASSEIERSSRPGKSHDRQGQNVSVLSSDIGALKDDWTESEGSMSSDMALKSAQGRKSLRGIKVIFKVDQDELPSVASSAQVHELPEWPKSPEARLMGLDGPQTEPPSENETPSQEGSDAARNNKHEFLSFNATYRATPTASEGPSEYETAPEEIDADDYPGEDEELMRLRQGESSRVVQKKVQKYEMMRWRDAAGRRRKGYTNEVERRKPWGWFSVRRVPSTSGQNCSG